MEGPLCFLEALRAVRQADKETIGFSPQPLTFHPSNEMTMLLKVFFFISTTCQRELRLLLP